MRREIQAKIEELVEQHKKIIDGIRCINQTYARKNSECYGHCISDDSNKLCPNYHPIHYVKYNGAYKPKLVEKREN